MSLSVTFQSVEHYVANALEKIHTEVVATEKALASVANNKQLEGTAELIAGIAGGVQAQDIVRVAFTALGAVSVLLAAGDAAAEAKLVNAGLDQSAINQVKALLPTIKTQLDSYGIHIKL